MKLRNWSEKQIRKSDKEREKVKGSKSGKKRKRDIKETREAELERKSEGRKGKKNNRKVIFNQLVQHNLHIHTHILKYIHQLKE